MKRMTIIASGVLAAGCTPLSQAGLVYSSQVQVGVSLASGTAETPGIKLNLGVTASDIAYVPVVVGTCAAGQQNCNQRLVVVTGENNRDHSEGDEENPDGGGGSDPGRKAMREDSGLQAKQPTPPGAPPVEGPPEAARAGADAAAAATNAVVKQRDSSDDIRDALSVYGTFDTNGGAGAPATGGSATGTLRMGRTFSTGVASQHLTRGIADSARVAALTACYNAAQTTAAGAPEADRAALLARLGDACAIAIGLRGREN